MTNSDDQNRNEWIPNFTGHVSQVTEQALRYLYQAVYSLRREGQVLKQKVENPPIPVEKIVREIEARGSHTLNVQGLSGQLSEPQKAKITVVQALPDVISDPLSQEGTLIAFGGLIYYFDTTVNPGQWTQLGALASSIQDTHANRLANFPAASSPKGTLFWETDRTVLYINTGTAWTYRLGIMRAAYASRPTDLGANDSDFKFYATDRTITYRWSGTVWNYYDGWQFDILANRPTPTADETGHLFFSTDEGWGYRWDGSAWQNTPTAIILKTKAGSVDGTAAQVALGGGGTSPQSGTLTHGDNTGWRFDIGTRLAGVFQRRQSFFADGLVEFLESGNNKTIKFGNYGTIESGGSQLIALGGRGVSPNAGSLWFGDGTGWEFHVGTRTAGNVFIKRFTFTDGGEFQIWEGATPTQRYKVNNLGVAFPQNTAAGIYSGSGTPEGAVTAAVGSVFFRTDGGAGTTLYIKESGVGNTGWVAVTSISNTHLTADCTAQLTLTTTFADVVGATVTLNKDGVWMILSSVEFSGNGGAGLLTCQLVYDSVAQVGTAEFQGDNATDSSIASTHQHWFVTNTGSKVAKLQGKKGINGGSGLILVTNTRISAVFLG